MDRNWLIGKDLEIEIDMEKLVIWLFIALICSMLLCRISFKDYIKNQNLAYNPTNTTRYLNVSDIVDYYLSDPNVNEDQIRNMKRYKMWEVFNFVFFPIFLIIAVIAVFV